MATAVGAFESDGAEAERVFSAWDHCEGDRIAAGTLVKVLRFQPGAKSRVADFRLVLPKVRAETALNLEMIELELDHRGAFGEIPSYVVHAHL